MRSKKSEYPQLDEKNVMRWIYPESKAFKVRPYQRNITRTCLFNNTLVVLPTGLGKTLVASVVMYNYYHWFKDGYIFFLAPTRPLVQQQVNACYNIMGIPRRDTAELTGKIAPAKRAISYKKKRVFFCTPHVINNDIKKKLFNTKKIVLIVFDEAHRVQGNSVGSQIMKQLVGDIMNERIRKNIKCPFRVIGLTATPGRSKLMVQNVVDRLCIERILVKSEEDIDMQKHVHTKSKKKIIVPLNREVRELKTFMERFFLSPRISVLRNNGLLNHDNPERFSKNQLVAIQQVTRVQSRLHGGRRNKFQIESNFGSLVSLYHGYELLVTQGIFPFYDYLLGLQNDLTPSFCRKAIKNDFQFKHLCQKTKSIVDRNVFHPKMLKVKSLVESHFQKFKVAGRHRKESEENIESRVMIFAQYRSTVECITKLLSSSRNIRCMKFVGQSTANDKEGLTQDQQREIIRRFRNGNYNCLASTSVGEEGLDIGEVDLIVCYDALSSPIRMIQRMGRTGRKRSGACFMMLTEGMEEERYQKAIDNNRYIYRMLKRFSNPGNKEIKLFQQLKRLIPSNIEINCMNENKDMKVRLSQSQSQENIYTMLSGSNKKKSKKKKKKKKKKENKRKRRRGKNRYIDDFEREYLENKYGILNLKSIPKKNKEKRKKFLKTKMKDLRSPNYFNFHQYYNNKANEHEEKEEEEFNMNMMDEEEEEEEEDQFMDEGSLFFTFQERVTPFFFVPSNDVSKMYAEKMKNLGDASLYGISQSISSQEEENNRYNFIPTQQQQQKQMRRRSRRRKSQIKEEEQEEEEDVMSLEIGGGGDFIHDDNNFIEKKMVLKEEDEYNNNNNSSENYNNNNNNHRNQILKNLVDTLPVMDLNHSIWSTNFLFGDPIANLTLEEVENYEKNKRTRSIFPPPPPQTNNKENKKQQFFIRNERKEKKQQHEEEEEEEEEEESQIDDLFGIDIFNFSSGEENNRRTTPKKPKNLSKKKKFFTPSSSSSSRIYQQQKQQKQYNMINNNINNNFPRNSQVLLETIKKKDIIIIPPPPPPTFERRNEKKERFIITPQQLQKQKQQMIMINKQQQQQQKETTKEEEEEEDIYEFSDDDDNDNNNKKQQVKKTSSRTITTTTTTTKTGFFEEKKKKKSQNINNTPQQKHLLFSSSYSSVSMNTPQQQQQQQQQRKRKRINSSIKKKKTILSSSRKKKKKGKLKFTSTSSLKSKKRNNNNNVVRKLQLSTTTSSSLKKKRKNRKSSSNNTNNIFLKEEEEEQEQRRKSIGSISIEYDEESPGKRKILPPPPPLPQLKKKKKKKKKISGKKFVNMEAKEKKKKRRRRRRQIRNNNSTDSSSSSSSCSESEEEDIFPVSQEEEEEEKIGTQTQRFIVEDNININNSIEEEEEDINKRRIFHQQNNLIDTLKNRQQSRLFSRGMKRKRIGFDNDKEKKIEEEEDNDNGGKSLISQIQQKYVNGGVRYSNLPYDDDFIDDAPVLKRLRRKK